MQLREKAKNLFRTRSKADRDTLSKTSSSDSKERWPSNVYKPGEPMPRPKYRAIPKKEHTDKLEAFSFAEAWRRTSFHSQYSPMGTRAPSRRNSSRGGTRQNSIFSVSKKSGVSRTNSLTSAETGDVKPARSAPTAATLSDTREGYGGAAKAPNLSPEPEQEGDDDTTNVGGALSPNALSRQRTVDEPRPDRTASHQRSASGAAAVNTAHDHHPFTEQDLSLALQRSHLAVPARG